MEVGFLAGESSGALHVLQYEQNVPVTHTIRPKTHPIDNQRLKNNATILLHKIAETCPKLES